MRVNASAVWNHPHWMYNSPTSAWTEARPSHHRHHHVGTGRPGTHQTAACVVMSWQQSHPQLLRSQTQQCQHTTVSLCWHSAAAWTMHYWCLTSAAERAAVLMPSHCWSTSVKHLLCLCDRWTVVTELLASQSALQTASEWSALIARSSTATIPAINLHQPCPRNKHYYTTVTSTDFN